MRILLIPQKSNYPDPNPCLDIFGQAFPYIAAALKVAGHEVFGINLNIVYCYGSAPITLESSLRNAIDKYQPDIIGIGGLSADYTFIRDTIIFLRDINPDIPIVCGGGIITFDPQYIFTDLKPDFAVIGEGEEVIVSLVEALQKNENIEKIANIAFWDNSTPIFTEPGPPSKSLDDLPIPDYSPFEYENYLKLLNQADNHFYAHTRHKPRVMPITLGRSCPYQCTFCCHTIGPKYRKRSIENAIDEIVLLYEKYEFNILFIYDELFASRKERIMHFCDGIKDIKKKSRMDFDWTCDLRVEHVDKDILLNMKDAGCSFIGYGFESASSVVLKSMKKKLNAEQMKRAIELTQEAGIGVQGNFIYGDISETKHTIQETSSFFDTYCTDLMIHHNYLSPYPGSEIFEYSIDNGIIPDKKEYYGNSGSIGKYRINMTKMPDTLFFKTIDGLCKNTSPDVHGKINLKEVEIKSCNLFDKFYSDKILPFHQRRSLYEIQVACPHCNKNVDYLYPIKILNPSKPDKLRVYCANCHRRFVIVFPENKWVVSKSHEIEKYYLFSAINSHIKHHATFNGIIGKIKFYKRKNKISFCELLKRIISELLNK